MRNTWQVKIDEQLHTIELNNRKLVIDGEKLKLNKFKKKTGLVQELYEFPVGSKTALLVLKNMSKPQLVIDNRDCATGEEYVPLKLPVWSYVFIILHFVNFMNGALGCLIAIIGIALTTAIVANTRMNVVLRLILSLAVLVLAIMLTFGIAWMVAGI